MNREVVDTVMVGAYSKWGQPIKMLSGYSLSPALPEFRFQPCAQHSLIGNRVAEEYIRTAKHIKTRSFPKVQR